MTTYSVSKFYKSSEKSSSSNSPSTPTQPESSTRDVSGEKRAVGGLPPPVKKKCHLTPEALWRLFPRQQMAFDFSKTCYQSSAVFAFESEELGRQGQRKYLVTTYYEFGQRYLSMKGLRHYYEVIVEDSACRLYFDIEFKKEPNPSVDGLALLDTFIQYICYQLWMRYQLSCDRTNILDLDSSSPTKFSRHLIFHLPTAVFKNNIHAGHFVHHCCDQLKSFKSQTDSRVSPQQAHSQHFPPPVTSRRAQSSSKCPSALELQRLFILSDQGKETLLCDEGVYTRNRNFRLYLSSKLGKDVSLRVSRENRCRSSYGEDSVQRRRSKRFNTLMDSLVCNVSFETCTRVLEFQPSQQPSATQRTRAIAASGGAGGGSEEGYCVSPFPSVDSFITSTLTRGGVQGGIRRWTYFSQGKQLLYDIHGNRWCENIGRAHNSNNIMIIADLVRGVYYQKCHDPECKKINFRSNEKPLPSDCNPLSIPPNDERSEVTDVGVLLGEVTDEEILQLETYTSYDSDAEGHTPSQDHDTQDHAPLWDHDTQEYTLPRLGGGDRVRDSSDSLDDLMLEALEEYEHSAVTGGGPSAVIGGGAMSGCEGQNCLSCDPKSADHKGAETVFNMSVEELNSFCEDINQF